MSEDGIQPQDLGSRKLSTTLMQDLTQASGVLNSLQRRVSRDDTLMLALRDNGLNVYYRGGNLLRLTAINGSGYLAYFDANYGKPTGVVPPILPAEVKTQVDCDAWVASFPFLKEIMNGFFAAHPKSEREFQQLVVWENNRSGVANQTEYFITDVEFADSAQSARFDMLGLKWPAHERKSGDKCRPVIFEMKYGDAAYGGAAGISKHIRDFNEVLCRPEARSALCQTIASQFNQLSELGLIRFNRSSSIDMISVVGRPEVVFLLSNHNPRSSKLLQIVNEIIDPVDYDLRFFASSFAGYGLHHDCMLDLKQFRSLLQQREK